MTNDTSIPVRSLPTTHLHDEDEESRLRIELPMTAHDRRRVRRIVAAPDGTQFALELPTGFVLQPGHVLHRAEGVVYVVTAAPEDVLVAHPHDVEQAALLGHLIGNLHRDIEVSGGAVIALADAALADRFRRAGVAFERAHRAFHGRAPGEHTH
jgi:urease accessory protein